MAIDSAAKRFSAINHGNPWRGTMVVPDGSVNRPAAAYMYSGIAFASITFVVAWARYANVLIKAGS